MRALILAAGFGSRLSERSVSKPLAKVRGKSLIELSIQQAIRAGVTSFTVVTGHQAARLEQELAQIAAKLAVPIAPVRAEDWSLPNGYSVMAGAQHCDAPFLLMMADHIFASDILERLILQPLDNCDAVLAVDRRTTYPLIDAEDATWVKSDASGAIRAIGKTITTYDAVDCGAFLANQNLSAAIKQAIAQGKPGSLSDGMQMLADQGRARVMDIGESWWLDVDDPASQDLAEAQMPVDIAPVQADADYSVKAS